MLSSFLLRRKPHILFIKQIMGGAAISNQKSLTAYQYLTILAKDIDFLLPHLIPILKQKTVTMPKITLSNKIKQVFETLTKTRKPHLLAYQKIAKEEVLLEYVSSFYHQYLLSPETPTQKAHELQNIMHQAEIVRFIRLMCFDQIKKEPTNDYLQDIYRLIKALTVYCQLVDNLLAQLDSKVAFEVYVTLWEVLQMQIPYLKTVYDFYILNEAFNSAYGNLSPGLRIEHVMGKIWGTTVVDRFKQVFLEDCKRSIESDGYRPPHVLAGYFRLYMDMNMNQYELERIGHSKSFEGNGSKLKSFLDELQINDEYFHRLGNGEDCVTFIDLWSQKCITLQAIFPSWVVEAYFGKEIIRLLDLLLQKSVKLLLKTVLPENVLAAVKREFQEIAPPFQFSLSLENQLDFNSFLQMHIEKLKPRESTLRAIVERMPEFKGCYQDSQYRPSQTTQGSGMQAISGLSYDGSNMEAEGGQTITNQVNQVKSEILEFKQPVISLVQSQTADAFEGGDKVDNAELMGLIMLSKRYDEMKFAMLESIESRDRRIDQRQRQLGQSADQVTGIFDNTHQVTLEEVNQVHVFLVNQKKINQIANYASVLYSGTIAEQLLSSIPKKQM